MPNRRSIRGHTMYETKDIVTQKTRQTLALLAVDEPWVMVRISSLISRRGYNIDTITVGKTHLMGISKIVLSFSGDDATVEKLMHQMMRVESVLKVVRLDACIERELCLVHIKAFDDAARERILSYINRAGYSVAAKDGQDLIIEAADTPQRIDSLLAFVDEFGILDLSRTGATAMSTTPALCEEECEKLR